MTVVEQLEASAKELAELRAAHDSQASELAALKSQIDEQARLSSEAIVKVQGEAVDARKALEAEQAAHVATKAELEKAQKALANPAFAAAAVGGSKEATSEGGAEAQVTRTMGDLMEEYKAIASPVEKAKWRKEHAKELGL